MTRLFPIVPLTSAISHAAVKLVKEFSGSGSDVVIEEDLAQLFGRCQIHPVLESSFKKALASGSAPSILCNNILLRYGAGPTVNRALSEPLYFPMIVQCSLLTSVHERNSLASTIAQIFEQRAAEAPADYPVEDTPSHVGLAGVLRACEDQTSGYDWGALLLAVAGALDVPVSRASEVAPRTILQGAITSFAIAQRLPEDRLVMIQSDTGICLLVVWAHHVLGLVVAVRIHQDKKWKEIMFGSGKEQVVIEDRAEPPEAFETVSITLLEAVDRTELFKLKAETDESALHSVFKRPARGFGTFALLNHFRARNSQDYGGMAHELTHLVIGRAIRLSKCFRMVSRANLKPSPSHLPRDGAVSLEVDEGPHSDEVFEIEENAVIAAAALLFDGHKFQKSKMDAYKKVYSRSPYNEEMRPQGPIEDLIGSKYAANIDVGLQLFKDFIPTLQHLSILVLAFAHVQDLEMASELPLSCDLDHLNAHSVAQELGTWDGCSYIALPEDVWFQAFVLLMVGESQPESLSRMSLVSDRGWSTYLSTHADADPTFTKNSFVVVQQGVPYRNGTWKHYILDGPKKGLESLAARIVHEGGEEFVLSCSQRTSFDQTLIGQTSDAFIVNKRLTTTVSGTAYTRRTGYRELCAALWKAARTTGCLHRASNSEKVYLPQDSVAISAERTSGLETEKNLIVCLTPGNPAARWRALLSLAHSRDEGGPDSTFSDKVLVRTSTCCMTCAVQQALSKMDGGRWFLIL